MVHPTPSAGPPARSEDISEPSGRPGDPPEPPQPASSPTAPTLPLPEWRERLDDLRARWAGGPVLAWVLAAAVAAGVGLWLLRPSPTPVEETLPLATTATTGPGSGSAPAGGSHPVRATEATTVPAPEEIVAHAAGAVARPGVYRLDPVARVDDLVRMAGGLAPDADASRLNLAAPLADGSRVYVPRVGEEVPEAVGPDRPPTPGGGGGGPPGTEEPGGLVDINAADAIQLDELPGVGPATATAIIAFREENGGFRTVDDLLDVRGIGEAKLEQIRPLVTVG